jgi:hypothetical protein
VGAAQRHSAGVGVTNALLGRRPCRPECIFELVQYLRYILKPNGVLPWQRSKRSPHLTHEYT